MTPTNKLRFVKRVVTEEIPNEPGISKTTTKHILQQWWEGEPEETWSADGDIIGITLAGGEWRDVPVGKDK